MKKKDLGWLLLIILIIFLASCRTERDGCGSYDKWEAKHSKFNK